MFSKILVVKSVNWNVGKRYAYVNDAVFQYWQKSKVPTMHFQRSLPRLPIPELVKTCDRYLAAQRPLLDSDTFTSTEFKVRKFQQTVGNDFQDILKSNDSKNKHTSYISEPWFDMYLSDRKQLPINYNPALVFLNDDRPEYNTQLIRSTNLIVSSLRFYRSLCENLLEPEVFHLNPTKSDTNLFRSLCSMAPSTISWYVAYMHNAYPLDMSQYHNLFNATRIPLPDKDQIRKKSGSSHILVQFGGNFFVFDVLDKNGYILPANVIYGNLKEIIERFSNMPNKFPIGILTTLERNKWADLRRHLINLNNKESLELIDSALFNICLDNNSVGEDPTKIFRNFLHGDGTNRWFDKSISLLVTQDGVGGVNFEHSWGDGVAVLRYFQDIHRDSIQNPHVHPDTVANTQENSVRQLEFNLDDHSKAAIAQSVKEYDTLCKSLDINVLQMDRIGKNICKEHKISPDALMQLGFQVAYYKLTGKTAASYESCSTAAFKHGRTETVRPCTTATKNYCLAVNSGKRSSSELRHFISECSVLHGQLTKEAAMGQGFDRHLFALKLIAEKSGKGVPEIFQDLSYAKINQNIISTSTLSSPSVWAGGFGPVVENGYGIGYSIKDDSLGVLVTTYPPKANGNDYVNALEEAYKEILNIFSHK